MQYLCGLREELNNASVDDSSILFIWSEQMIFYLVGFKPFSRLFYCLEDTQTNFVRLYYILEGGFHTTLISQAT